MFNTYWTFFLQIETKKIELNVTSKIGSLDNVKHRPGGGDKKIFDDKEYLKQKSAISSLDHSLSGSQVSLYKTSMKRNYEKFAYFLKSIFEKLPKQRIYENYL